MWSHRAYSVQLACVVAVSIAVAIYMGGVTRLMRAGFYDAWPFPSDLMALMNFYWVPVYVTGSLHAPLRVSPWIWTGTLFLGVLVQNGLLWGLVLVIVRALRRPAPNSTLERDARKNGARPSP